MVLKPPVIPPDIILGIMNELLAARSWKTDLKACVLVSHLWCNITRPLLFRDIVVKLYKPADAETNGGGSDQTESHKSASAFLNFLQNSTHIALLIRRFTYRVNQEQELHYMNPSTFLSTLRLLPNLQSLQLVDLMFPPKTADISGYFEENDFVSIPLKSLSLCVLDSTHFRWEKTKPYASPHRVLLASGVFGDVDELRIVRATWGETDEPFKHVPEHTRVHSLAIHSWELKRSLKLMCSLNMAAITSVDLGGPTNESLMLALKQFFPLTVNLKNFSIKLQLINTQDSLIELLESTLKKRNLESIVLQPLEFTSKAVEETDIFLRHLLRRVPPPSSSTRCSRPSLSVGFDIANQDVMGPPAKALGRRFPKVIEDLAKTLEVLQSTPETTRLQFIVKPIRQVKYVEDEEELEEVILDEEELKSVVPSQYLSLIPLVSFDFVVIKA